MADDQNTGSLTTVPYIITALVISFVVFVYLFVTKQKKKTSVILFTRYPKAGKAKTRLIPELGPEGAAATQVCMTEHILKALQNLCSQRPDTDVVIQYNGGTAQEMDYWLSRKLHGLPCIFSPQCGRDLGEKLTLAIQDRFRKGRENVIVIGGDIPGIKSDIINKAIAALTNTDMVIGKAEDGGYYLIGVSAKTSYCLDRLFEGMNWGTSTVYDEQVMTAKKLNLTITTLPQVLQDVDTAEDLCVFEKEVGVSRHVLSHYKWSVIIPVLNEEKNIVNTLKSILNAVSDPSNLCDIVVCDGGSADDTCKTIEGFAETSKIPVKLAHSRKGRGFQLVGGAKVAKGDHLLFVHADTVLPKNFDMAATECLRVPGNVAGAFRFKLDLFEDPQLRAKEPMYFVLQMHCLQRGTNLRCHRKELPYGDQALFMSKKIYEEVGGYPHYCLMEDYVMVEKLHTIGHVGITNGYSAITSYRRWRKFGFLKVTGFNQIILMAYKLGVHPDTLAKWYYGDKVKFD